MTDTNKSLFIKPIIFFILIIIILFNTGCIQNNSVKNNEKNNTYNFIYIYGNISYQILNGTHSNFLENGVLPDSYYQYNLKNKTITLKNDIDKKSISSVIFSQYYLNHANSSVTNFEYKPIKIITSLPHSETIILKGLPTINLTIDENGILFINEKQLLDKEFSINSSWIETYSEYNNYEKSWENATVQYSVFFKILNYGKWNVNDIIFK